MRTVLTALTAELKRLKAAGVKEVAVADESLAALRRAVDAHKSDRGKNAAPLLKESATARGADAARPMASVSVPVAAPAGGTLPKPPCFELPEGDKAARWSTLRNLVLNDATCLAHVRAGKRVVFGVGNIEAQIMFVGEAPGAEEEVQGEPFVGPAGQLLTKMIAGMGLKRSDVYIGNIMNWRPEIATAPGAVQYGNRPPTQEEMAYCLPLFKAQIAVVNPALLVALGATAAQGLLGGGSFKALGEVRGRWHEFAGKPLMITYHPSYILRNPTNRSKRLIWEDLLKVMERAGLPISEKQRGFFLDK